MLKLNSVKERLMFLSPVVQAGWERESNIKDFEKIGDLGKGAFGIVTHMKHKKSMIGYAIKQMNKQKLKASGMISHIKTEIKIMYSLNHDNIIKLYNHFEDDDCIYLVLEYAPGGQLWQKLHKCEGKKMPEKQVAVYIKDLVHALEYLHAKGIIHRDIKPENLLLDSNGRLKLADFGWSNYLKPDTSRTTFCGTLDYLAPEMLQGGHEHDHMVDIWTVGVLIYELLTGKSPFAPKDALKLKDIERATQQNIVNGKYEFPKEFPTLAKDLVNKILKKNPKSRLSLQDIKTHPWTKVNTQDAKKKELNPEVLIQQVVFAQNMADQKNFSKVDEKDNVDPAFSEDEIIQYTRPDSMLDKNQEANIEVSNNIQEQVNNNLSFKIQLEKIICTTPNGTSTKPLTPKGENKPLTPKGENKPLTPKGDAKRDATPENTKREVTPEGTKRNLTPDNKAKSKIFLKEEEKDNKPHSNRDLTPDTKTGENKTPKQLTKINFSELGANIIQKSPTTMDLSSPKDAISAAGKIEAQLKIKTQEADYYKQEYEKLKQEKNSWNTNNLMINALEQESVSLRLQVQELEKKVKEKDSSYNILEKEKNNLEEKLKKLSKERSKSPSGSSMHLTPDDAIKNMDLQLKEAIETRNRDKIYYESKITELEAKLNYLQKGTFNTENGTKSKLDELEDMNKNLSQQISNYSKLLKAVQRDDSSTNDEDKEKMTDEIRTLQALSAVKQERIEKLERKLRSLSGQYKVV